MAAMLPTADELERLHQQAHDEGFAAGHRAGSAKVAAEAERLRQIVDTLTGTSQQFDQSLANDLVELALAISQQVMRQMIELRPELILPVVNEVLGQLPLSHQRARLILHPEDVDLVKESLGDRIERSGWEILGDMQMGRGGCRLEATECEIDATLESRWQRVVSAIGSDGAWIE
ncbi:MAG: flagellar assembly protein FliH [Dechloromonas sp.]|uniref:Flagellar assembly protein FliH n=1 Tax=Candidatus Dechloromonas phosphorivorans TaxID=2899244 RepID=A0A9D7LNS3_9RHOO|nr:flagellar assembly protein FliH [Candidatus Dechloromonas phosphorivorans]